MSSDDYLRTFIVERLTVAAEEIFRVIQQKIDGYEAELDHQRSLVGSVRRAQIKLHRIGKCFRVVPGPAGGYLTLSFVIQSPPNFQSVFMSISEGPPSKRSQHKQAFLFRQPLIIYLSQTKYHSISF